MSNYNTTEFAGLTRFDNCPMNEAVRNKYLDDEREGDIDASNLPSLREAIMNMPPVETGELYLKNPYANTKQNISTANATFNPDVAIESGDGSADDMVYAVHSGGYATVPHTEFFRPLTRALSENDIGNIAGQFRSYNNGAQIHGEVVFQNPEQQLNMKDDSSLFTGISVGNSYDGTSSMYAMGYAMDTYCNNSMRNLTEKRSRKHVGDPEETENWWSEILAQMDEMQSALKDIIEQALEIEINFLEQPFDVEEFYTLLGIPEYLARSASTEARNRSPREGGDRVHINFWTLHSGLTSALTHDFSGSSEVGALETYSRIAKDLLWNPGEIVTQVKDEYETRQRREATTEMEKQSVDDNVATIERYEQSLDDRAEQFEEFEEQIAGVLEAE